ncbi:putative bifunctional diguanylate cyclase/phosphodiesterase [Sulfurospirillum oryzae]|uniref:putative bifunctional diguanylate cyclase/phosphodiesterase n=1 Tax=Sulfurospirillum oryzae TaxID=2976535 RepID=UPI0021E7F8ED|nr:EAL domain-containing protein [Sulfurospirillum oryzae]
MMQPLSIQRLALYSFAVLLIGTIMSGAILVGLLFNYETIKNHQQISKNAYDALFTLKYNTENLLVTNQIHKEVITWESSFEKFTQRLNALQEIALFHSNDIDDLLQSIHVAKLSVSTQLQSPLFDEKNIMEKSLLRRLGEGLNANETSPYYIAVRDLISAIDYLKQYEDFLLDELCGLDIQIQNESNVKLKNTKNMVVAIPLLAFIFTLTVGTILWYTIGKIEKKLEDQREKLDYTAYHDYLTKLANRAQFITILEKTLEKAQQQDLRVGLLFIDLDRFKEINDSYGHSVGDMVLCEIAERLNTIAAHDALIARLGGDEFTLIVEDKTNEEIEHLVQSIVATIQKPLLIYATEMYLTCSIGISLFPKDAKDAESLLRNADTAMYIAKNKGKNTFQFYNQSMTEASIERLQMESHLRRAIDKEELVLYYQPQVDVNSGKITGAEALLRWNDNILGNVSPAKFIPLSEETGLILPLGNWVLKEAFIQQSKWLQSGVAPDILAINIAAKQIYHTDLVAIITGLLETYAIDPNTIELEITERIIVENPDYTTRVLNTLRSLGVRISIDDFGTGYSSLSYLKTLPLDKIKIDQSFIRGIPASHEDKQIVKTIISLSQGLDKTVIAEGVETEEQKSFLQEAGCFEMQGYLFAKALPAVEFEQFMREARI